MITKSMKRWFKNFIKDKWNIAILVLIVLTVVLGFMVVGVIKTMAVIGLVVAIVLILKYGGSFIMASKNKGSDSSQRRRKKLPRMLSRLIVIFLSLGIFAVIGGFVFLGFVVITAPKFDTKKLAYKEESIIYDNKNNEVMRIGNEKREKVTFDEMPQVFVDAIVATEDSRFFEHNGLDLPRFIKASFGQLFGKSSAGGASTISMQVIKNNFTNVSQSITRKFTDIYLSVFKLEKQYTKEQILEFYVNNIHLGVDNSLGIAETSRELFGKEISDINLSQAALLAGMFQAPSAYNPYNNPKAATARRHTVLYLMNLHGYITDEQMKIADNIPISSIIVPQQNSKDPFQCYVDYVIQEVKNKTGYDPMEVPMNIYTNMNVDKQNYITGIMNGTNYTWVNDVVQAGVAVVDPNTGGIVALGGGRGEHMNAKARSLATDTKLQIGSTAKPLFDYGPGMEYNNWSTYTPFVDDVYSYSDGKPINDWDGKYNGMLTLRYALAESRNVPALKAFKQVDNKKIIQFVESLGITPEVENGRIHEAHSIGGFNGMSPLQLAAAYAAFANGGYYTEPYAVNKIEIMDTNKVVTFKPEKVRVMSDSTAYMITNVLKFGVDSGLIGSNRLSGYEVAAKSGTSNFDQATKDKKHLADDAINDLWYASYSPDYVFGMWYGYENVTSQYYNHTTAGSVARDKLWAAIGKGIFEHNGHKFTIPDSVIEVPVEKDSIPAMLPSQYTPSSMILKEYFKKGTEPTEVSPRFNTLPNVTGLDASKSGSDVTLSWTAAKVESTVTEEYINTIIDHKDKYLSIREQADASLLGSLGYNIYVKNSDGSLKWLGWTGATQFKHTPTSSGSLTYVVKTCYSNFKSSESSGTTSTLSDNPYVSVPTFNLKGQATVSITKGTTYTDAGVSVLVDSKEVNPSSISITVTNKAGTNHTYTSISEISLDTSTSGEVYTLTYKVSYGTSGDTLTRTVTITE